MFQMLNLWHDISYEIVRGIYVFVAKIYDLMIGLVESTTSYDFTEFTQSIYVVAGLFMLFRVVIGMVQMIINPDQVTDKNAGAGKLITRIVLVIVLLLAFAPTSFLMKPNGVFDRIENAIIGPDGLLENFSPEARMNQNYSDIASDILTNNDVIIENVYAGKVKTCYFAQLSSTTVNNQATVNESKYRVDFYNNKCSGCKKVGKNSNLYVKVNSGTEKYNGTRITFKNIKFNNNNANPYPKLNTINDCSNWYITPTTSVISHNSDPTFLSLVNDGKYYRGYNSISAMVTAVEKDKKDNPDAYGLDKAIAGIQNDEAVCFATNTISSFQECVGTDEEKKECQKAKLGQFGGGFCSDEIELSANNPEVTDLMDSKKMELSFMIGIIAGVLIIVFLVILCVDVVIRNLKLMLLDMLAPIPIICYADPKDKIFMNWLKMYFSVYVDLFIKLFAIKIALVLIAGFDYDEITGIEYFFVIIAILLFAKMIPSMISKIFGIELSGSMKDIGNMIKSGAGFAAGAALGAGAGALTMGAGIAGGKTGMQKLGAGVQGLGNIAKGTIAGAAAGSKGKIGSGASNVLAAGKQQREATEQGATMMGIFGARAANAFGFDDAYTKEKNEIDQLKRDKSNTAGALANVKSIKSTVEDNMNKKAGEKGYRGLQAVEDWHAAKNRLEALKSQGADEHQIATAQKAVDDSYKPALDAAINEEFRRVSTNSSNLDQTVKTSLDSFNTYNEALGENKQEALTGASSLSSAKDELTRIEANQSSNITTRENKLEESKIKAEHDAAQKKKYIFNQFINILSLGSA